MKKKSKDKKPAQKKWILLLAAALFFICNSSVMWAKVQEHFFENSINDTLSATVMSSQAVITDSATAKTDEKAVEKTVELSKCIMSDEDIRGCMNRQIAEYEKDRRKVF